MAKRGDLTAARKTLLSRARNEDCLLSVGIGLVDAEPGLIVSVKPRSRTRARAVVAAAGVSVPVAIREIGPVRKRPARKTARTRRAG